MVQAACGIRRRGPELDDVGLASGDAVPADEAVGVGLVQGQVERHRDHLFGLDQRKLGDVLPPHPVAVDVVARLLPLQLAAALPEVAAVDRNVDPRSALGQLEMEVDAALGDPALQPVVLIALQQLVLSDDLLGRQTALGRHLELLRRELEAGSRHLPLEQSDAGLRSRLDAQCATIGNRRAPEDGSSRRALRTTAESITSCVVAAVAGARYTTSVVKSFSLKKRARTLPPAGAVPSSVSSRKAPSAAAT